MTDSQVQGKRQRIQYSKNDSFSVGEVLCFLEDRIAADNDAFYRDQVEHFWSADHPEEMVRGLGEWADKVKLWVEDSGLGEAASEDVVRIVVTADHDGTRKKLRDAWEGQEPPKRIEAVDAGAKKKYDELRMLIDKRSKADLALDLLILARAEFLPHKRLEVDPGTCFGSPLLATKIITQNDQRAILINSGRFSGC